MRTRATLAMVAMLGTAAVAEDRIDSAISKHLSCISNEARWLAKMDGSPEALSERALRLCKAEERALIELLDEKGVKAFRAITKAAGVTFIEQARELGGWALSPPSSKDEIYCASCGMIPTWDSRLKIWRLYRR